MSKDFSRLRELATVVLPNVPDNEFNLSTWRCDTTACAVGHAANYKPFQELGLGLQRVLSGMPAHTPSYNNSTGWTAVNKFFNIRTQDSFFLFDIDEYPNRQYTTREEVIQRILEFIED